MPQSPALPRPVGSAALLMLLTTGAAVANPPSWIFSPSTYTHDPQTGARVAQYQPTPPVEPLPDPRIVTSRFRRSRTTIRGADGSVDSTFEVQNVPSAIGGLDAEWERFHDAWRQSLLTGSFFFQNQPVPLGTAFGLPGDAFNPTFGPGLPNGAFGDPRFANPFPPSPSFGPAPFDPRRVPGATPLGSGSR